MSGVCNVDWRWFSVVGLVLDFVGAMILISSVIVSKREALELGVPDWAAETDEENLRLPMVRNLRRQSALAVVGFVFVAAGSVLQIIGAWPR